MIQAMTSGHAGSMSTLHASVAMDAMNRLETLAMMNKVELPLHALRAQISSAIDVIVLVSRFNDGRRGLTQIAEVMPLDKDGRYQVQEIFAYRLEDTPDGRAGKGKLAWTGRKSYFRNEPKVRMLKNQRVLTNAIFEESET